MKNKQIFTFLKNSNRVIENPETGYYTVVSPCSCKSQSCGNFNISIYRNDDKLTTKLWIHNDTELNIASHYFRQDMETNKSLLKSIIEDSKPILIDDEELMVWEN